MLIAILCSESFQRGWDTAKHLLSNNFAEHVEIPKSSVPDFFLLKAEIEKPLLTDEKLLQGKLMIIYVWTNSSLRFEFWIFRGKVSNFKLLNKLFFNTSDKIEVGIWLDFSVKLPHNVLACFFLSFFLFFFIFEVFQHALLVSRGKRAPQTSNFTCETEKNRRETKANPSFTPNEKKKKISPEPEFGEKFERSEI